MAISDDTKYSLTGAEIKTLISKVNEKAPASSVYTKTEIDSKLTSAMTYKGTVATVADLPSIGNKVGDVYNVTATGDNYAWDGSNWDQLSGVVDLSNYYTKTETNAELDTKVDKVSGKGLSTEDFTTADKTKLNGIESGAEANTIESISVNGTQQTITNKNVDLVIENSLSGNTAPTTATEGTLGQTYVDTSTGDIYYLSEIDETTSPATYTWEKLATGTGVNVVQTTGSSTTDVMSQNAVTSALDNVLVNGGTTVPTSSTEGQVGTQYNCVNNGEPEIYICTAVDTSTTPNTYTWKKVGLTLQLSTTDPGEGSPLADNTILGIYE